MITAAITFDTVEVVGYVASALIVVSLAMSSVVRLRLINLAGSTTFVAYGVFIESVPVVVTNAAIMVLNVFYLRRELGGGRDLGAVVVEPDSPFLVDFVEHHRGEIERIQPGFDFADPVDTALVLRRDGLPAGVVLGRRVGAHLDVTLDYVLPAYRDSRLGHWLYGPGRGVLTDLGVDEVVAVGGTPGHEAYLRRIGFVRRGDAYRRDLRT